MKHMRPIERGQAYPDTDLIDPREGHTKVRYFDAGGQKHGALIRGALTDEQEAILSREAIAGGGVLEWVFFPAAPPGIHRRWGHGRHENEARASLSNREQ